MAQKISWAPQRPLTMMYLLDHFHLRIHCWCVLHPSEHWWGSVLCTWQSPMPEKAETCSAMCPPSYLFIFFYSVFYLFIFFSLFGIYLRCRWHFGRLHLKWLPSGIALCNGNREGPPTWGIAGEQNPVSAHSLWEGNKLSIFYTVPLGHTSHPSRRVAGQVDVCPQVLHKDKHCSSVHHPVQGSPGPFLKLPGTPAVQPARTQYICCRACKPFMLFMY